MSFVLFSETKYSHNSPWPAFTETIHQDSVTKKQEKPGALKVSQAPPRKNICQFQTNLRFNHFYLTDHWPGLHFWKTMETNVVNYVHLSIKYRIIWLQSEINFLSLRWAVEAAGQGWATSLSGMDRGGNPDFESSLILSSSDPALTLARRTRRTAPVVQQQDAEARGLSWFHWDRAESWLSTKLWNNFLL